MDLMFILPFAENQKKRSFGSGCGVPLIMLNDDTKCAGITKNGYNLVVKNNNHWIGDSIMPNIQECYDVIANSNNNYVLTKINLGPNAVSNRDITPLIKLKRPSNVMLCGTYQHMCKEDYFLGYLIDCRDDCTELVDDRICERINHFSTRYKTVTWLANRERANFDVISKVFSARKSNLYQPFIDLALLHLSTAAIILCNRDDTPLVRQRAFWCQLYNVPFRVITINE